MLKYRQNFLVRHALMEKKKFLKYVNLLTAFLSTQFSRSQKSCMVYAQLFFMVLYV